MVLKDVYVSRFDRRRFPPARRPVHQSSGDALCWRAARPTRSVPCVARLGVDHSHRAGDHVGRNTPARSAVAGGLRRRRARAAADAPSRRTKPLAMVAIAFGLTTVGPFVRPGDACQMFTASFLVLLVSALFRWGSGRDAVIGSFFVVSGSPATCTTPLPTTRRRWRSAPRPASPPRRASQAPPSRRSVSSRPSPPVRFPEMRAMVRVLRRNQPAGRSMSFGSCGGHNLQNRWQTDAFVPEGDAWQSSSTR